MDDALHAFIDAPISRTRDRFLRELLRELSGILEDTIGLEETEGFVAMVGNRLGIQMNEEYLAVAGCDRMDAHQVAGALVDLKRRIDGGFAVESIDADKIVLVNTACPFGTYVEGRESLCMMTSNVFGRLTASNLGYARVELEETIARGHPGCRVIVHFNEGEGGREYYS